MNHAETTAASIDAIIDRAEVLERFEGDMDLVREVAELFIADCPHRLAAVREALADGDSAGLQRAAHSLKGSVSNFSAGAAVEAALRLEMLARAGDLTDAATACSTLEREIARLMPALLRLTQAGETVGDNAGGKH